MVAREFVGEGVVSKNRLDRGLTVVEVALDREHGQVVPGLGDHLALLDGGDPTAGVAHGYLGMRAVREPRQRSHAGVARGGHQDEEVAVAAALRPRQLQGLREEEGHALEGHVLEGQRRPVPQFQREAVLTHGANGRDLWMIEVVAIGLPGDRLDPRVGQVEFEPSEDVGCPLPVGHAGQRSDVVQGQVRQPLGDEEPTSRSDALKDGLRVRRRLVEE